MSNRIEFLFIHFPMKFFIEFVIIFIQKQICFCSMSKMNICRIVVAENIVTLHFGDANRTIDWILKDFHLFFISIIIS